MFLSSSPTRKTEEVCTHDRWRAGCSAAAAAAAVCEPVSVVRSDLCDLCDCNHSLYFPEENKKLHRRIVYIYLVLFKTLECDIRTIFDLRINV